MYNKHPDNALKFSFQLRISTWAKENKRKQRDAKQHEARKQ